MNADKVLEVFREVRKDLDMTRGTEPIIVRIHNNEDGLHIITSDRSEKSLFLGPRGRIIAELSKRLNCHVSVYGQDELLIKKHRLGLTLRRIRELIPDSPSTKQRVLKVLENYVENEIKLFSKDPNQPGEQKDLEVGVAFSGGVDSGASVLLMKQMGILPIAITIDSGPRFLAPHIKDWIKNWCQEIGISSVIAETDNEQTEEILESVEKGHRHPCNQCHKITMQKARDIALELGLDVLVTGEMLPTGRQSIINKHDVLIIHLPAALALTKFDTSEICKVYSFIGSKDFGCHVVAYAHERAFQMREASIFRVLRELQGGILTTGKAMAFIKKILRKRESMR